MRWWLAVVAVAVAAPAAADEAPDPVAVKVSATSTRKGKHAKYAASNVIGGPGGWCARRKSAQLTLALATPVAIDAIEIDAQVDGSAWSPKTIAVSLDDGSGAAQTAVEASMAKNLVARAEVSATVATIEIDAPADDLDELACISAVRLARGGAYLRLIATDTDAVAALPDALDQIRDAFDTCNAKALGRVIKFPFAHKELVEDGWSRTKYRRPRDLAKACDQGVLAGLPIGAASSCSAAGLDRIVCDVAVPQPDGNLSDELELAWRKRRWRIVGWSTGAYWNTP